MEAIIFDMDGVILDSEPIWGEAETRLLAKRGKKYDSNIKPKLMGRSQLEAMTILAQHYQLDEPIEALSRERLEIVRSLYAQVNWMPGFLEFLEKVKTTDYKRAIATGTPQEIFNIANERLKLEERIGICITADQIARAKPHPDIFLLAANKLGLEPNTCAVIEDSPNGILAAKAAGMYTIGITTTTPRDQLYADEVVDAFAEIDLRRLRNYTLRRNP